MNNSDKDWQQFLDGHKDFVEEIDEENSNLEKIPEKEYGLTLFSGEADGFYMIFNTQIDIFQFVKLLRYFFGINGVEIGHSFGAGHHYHDEDDDEEDDDYEDNEDE